ncbi:MAG: hypothetical protein ACXWUH_16740 [Burkholderiales bacterium]
MLDVTLEDRTRLNSETQCVLGHPDNPLTWDALREKFDGLVEPVLGPDKCGALFDHRRNFLQPGTIGKISEHLAG